jgi:hypothetical protein
MTITLTTFSGLGLLIVVLTAARDLSRKTLRRYTLSAFTGVAVTATALLLVHPVNQAAAGLVAFSGSILLATHGHPVRLADAKFFVDELGVDPPAALLSPDETRRVQRRFILYVVISSALIVAFL